MTSQERTFHEFAEFAAALKGDRRSEAQTFLFLCLFVPICRQQLSRGYPRSREKRGNTFNSLVRGGEPRACARRSVVQRVGALFADDIGLLPQNQFAGKSELANLDPVTTIRA
ncbi:MAG: hypothetical protein HYZ36_03350 [Pedosphaera parvula]|nr:hypothetical protein [Verrucomicrobiota bacterium]MBI3191677.1 hypothetical protein [Pedosphaera parvula]